MAHILKTPHGKLTPENLVHLLTSEEAWSALTEEQQKRLYLMLPEAVGEDNLPRPLDPTMHPMHYGDYAEAIKLVIADWKRDIDEDRNAKWRKAAMEASKARAAGKYDAGKDNEREEYWGQKAGRSL